MNGNFKKSLFVSTAISMLILIISSTASYISIRNLLESSRLVKHTQDVIYNLNEGAAIMVDAQTSMRGFLITGKTSFLEQYTDAERRATEYFDTVRDLTSDSPVQQADLKVLYPIKDSFFAYLETRVEAKRSGQIVEKWDLDRGKQLMTQIRNTVRRMEAREKSLLRERNAAAQKYGEYSVALIITAAILSLAISCLFFMRILKNYRERNRLHQELQRTERETAERIKVISGIANEISKGNYEIRVDDRESDALGGLGISLNNMAASLDRSFKNLAIQEWIQAGIANINNVMIGEKTPRELTSDIITFLAEYTESSAGVLYVADNDGLTVSAGYSYAASPDRKHLKLGEGLSGQAAVSGKMIELRSLEAASLTISYALGDAKPTHIVAIPLNDESVVGVVELGSVRTYEEHELAFLKAVTNNVAVAIKASQNRQRVQELLEETQAQSEELAAQHTELESINAELEVQTEKLQASEEELRVQQEELQQTNEELWERSVLLEEKNVEIQKKSEDLEQSTRYKSEFLANMSHELRTPLNSILLLSRLLSENNEHNMSAEQVEFAKVIQSSGNGLLALIDEILDLSKIEAGKMELEFIEVPVKEITDAMKDLFRAVAKEKNIGFSIDTEHAPLVIRTDKMRLEQILKNLISNAIKFTSHGEVRLTVTKSTTDPDKACFSVQDTGIGITAEKQPLIFEAFQQADGSTKRKYGGTGLGLSISRELAKLLHGDITLKSEVGHGSTFTLCIPVSGQTGKISVEKNRPAIREEIKPAIKIEQNSPNYLSPVIPADVPDDRESLADDDKTILIVEDDTHFAKSLLEFTHQRGYKGIVSVRGDQAMSLALAYKPAGILLDIQLPVKSGWDVMEELKSSHETRHIPVHIMSSHRLKQESLLKGAVHFLDKPVAYEQMPDVFKRIEHIISRESQKVLIVEDNPKHARALAYFLETHNITPEIKSDVNESIDALKNQDVDCVILDMGIPDRQAYDVLENVKKNPGLENLPVIVFTGKSLSMQEELRIKKYADSIIVKTAHSYQRMLDEVSLFLHLVEEKKKTNGRSRNLNSLLPKEVLTNKTVLIVDDDVRNIYSLTKALEVLQMNVITAIDGKEALNALSEHPDTDVVLLDMMMPNMDGYETATRIRKNPKFKNLPVIAVTAKAMTGDREKCIQAGASDYITKPVDIDQLLSLLRVWLYDRS